MITFTSDLPDLEAMTNALFGMANKFAIHDGVFKLPLPGIGKDNIEIFDDGRSIAVTWKDAGTTKRVSIKKEDVHSDTTAEYKDGILYLRNPLNTTEPKKIEIK